MKLTEQDIKNLWQQTAGQGDCLTDDLLLRAGSNDLAETERQQIADHLAGCADCTAAYQIARAANVWAKETAAEYEPKSAKPVRPRSDGWLSFFDFARFRPAQVVLAAVLLVAVGAGAWALKLRNENKTLQATLHQQQEERSLAAAKEVSQLQQNAEQLLASNQSLTNENSRLKEELDALAKPQLETPIIDVDPVNNTRGVPTAITRVEVPSAAAFFTLILHLSKEPPGSTLFAELRDAQQNNVVWSGQVQKGSAPNLTLLLARRNLPAGKYRVQLSAVSGKRRMPLDHYELEIVYPGGTSSQSKPLEPK